MAQNKTKESHASVETYLAAIADDARRRDCEALAQMMSRVTKHAPKKCLYIRNLQDIDAAILEQLVAASVAEVERRYP